jgi:hypothetical protein
MMRATAILSSLPDKTRLSMDFQARLGRRSERRQIAVVPLDESGTEAGAGCGLIPVTQVSLFCKIAEEIRGIQLVMIHF